MARYISGCVVIEVTATGAACEQPCEIASVDGKGNIQHRELVAGLRLHAIEQADVALDAGDENALPRFVEPQLVQRANAVRVAVEDVIEWHKVLTQYWLLPSRMGARFPWRGSVAT